MHFSVGGVFNFSPLFLEIISGAEKNKTVVYLPQLDMYAYCTPSSATKTAPYI